MDTIIWEIEPVEKVPAIPPHKPRKADCESKRSRRAKLRTINRRAMRQLKRSVYA